PADNPSGLAQNLPSPPPAEFDVADIKLSMPGTPQTGRIQPGGRIDFQGITLKTLMNIAWDITGHEMLVGAPKWFDETRYSLQAVASTAVAGSATGLQI